MTHPSHAGRNFRSLSVRDLLDARDAYHVHLANLENVVATAIGLYRIRQDDPDAHTPVKQTEWRHRHQSPERTLENTIVQPWSWPCVLVFVKEWQTQQALIEADPDQVVPRFLYLPDGRIVPTCVILAPEQQEAPPSLRDVAFPHDMLGGGYPLVTDTQGHEHIGSAGCLVTDGNNIYVLTNQHVSGEPGNTVYTISNGQRQAIGQAITNQLRKRGFAEVYPDWSGTNAYLNLDAGLIRIEDLSKWTAQIFGLGELGAPVNLNPENISLDLIGLPVCAHGAASGKMYGEVQALFYRYCSMGGFDYVSELLIGSRPGQPALQTMPGDSGTIWCLDPDRALGQQKSGGSPIKAPTLLRPLALQWGGHVVQEAQGSAQLRFALASCLSIVCHKLDVDLVTSWNTGHREYWGEVGHYKIAGSACDILQLPNLKTLMSNNKDAIAFGDDQLVQGTTHIHGGGQFVPLADVADLVWRTTRPRDESNHFADMDQPGQGAFDGQTLLDLCQDEHNVSITLWNNFYDALNMDAKRGALPFRVWQMYDEMVAALKQQDVASFVCIAGTMAHYVGDACQPLHVSYLHHGHPDQPSEHGVHSAYETAMVNRFTAEIVDGVNQKLAGITLNPPIAGGKQAALAVIAMMRHSLQFLPPETIIAAYNTGSQMHNSLNYMWQQLGEQTIQLMVDGAQCLASIWESAWREATGEQSIPSTALGTIPTRQLQQLYSQPGLAPSYQFQDPRFAQELTATSADKTSQVPA
ncbi:hypothetical protein KSC_088060 [Ktedonobacter sp. SOSP1-52]|uniref:hypothetical protein n=1 Tax=Ktedonobacter sp. SOSP1-52 TaxID=2778366 RepID=UPI00191672FB|nr:hypothetical protein [Ktedonobacter sp. SOSP1-52]GHO69914.1 hypothetical protein KSC_088060 [Ktedonobacter sp. SOSP1-52]